MPDFDIADPFGGSLDTYRKVADELEAALDKLIEKLAVNQEESQSGNQSEHQSESRYGNQSEHQSESRYGNQSENQSDSE